MTTPVGSPVVFPGTVYPRLEWAPTNGPYDPFPTWVDITNRLETQSPGAAVEITRGAQSELSSIEASQLTFVLKNFDNAFTFGYTGGPYGSNWGPAKQVRYSETHGGRTFQIFKGWLEAPDIQDWQPIGQQYVQVSALDRLTRFGSMPPFVSTLGAHIVGSGSSRGLVFYLPMNDSPIFSNQVGASPNLTPSWAITNPGVTASQLYGQANFGVTADDTVGESFTVYADANGYSYATLGGTLSLAASSSQTVTLAAWIRPGVHNAFLGPGGTPVNIAGGPVGDWSIYISDGASGGVNFVLNGTNTFVTFPTAYPKDTWRLVTASVNLATGAYTVWCGSDLTLSGTAAGAPTSATYSSILLGNAWLGTLAHLQIYIGATTMTRADHLAQFAVGMTGLEGQTTGQRINTILDYAGVASTDRQVDPGQSYMQKAKLAGQTPKQALQNAANTERGRLFISGDGRTVFHDRVRTLNL